MEKIVEALGDTEEAEIIGFIHKSYQELNESQNQWLEKSDFHCIDGCGCCCHNFEPDLLEGEVLYMAAWIIANNQYLADALAFTDTQRLFSLEAESDNSDITDKTCIFYNPNNAFHCSIYEGRPFICRLFGASASKDKHGEVCWKPCKFYPAKTLENFKTPLNHRQYSKQELIDIFGTIPPIMSNVMENVIGRYPGRTPTKALRTILPETIKKIYWLISLNGNHPTIPNPDMPRAS
ncbi:MAG: YkgJ family cysteine cluster protein [Treponema sp.]|nr:YkgJ family cysteine cluster protein [Treponema sp.]